MLILRRRVEDTYNLQVLVVLVSRVVEISEYK